MAESKYVKLGPTVTLFGTSLPIPVSNGQLIADCLVLVARFRFHHYFVPKIQRHKPQPQKLTIQNSRDEFPLVESS